MVDLGGYVIILVETKDKKIKLYGSPADKADLEVGDEILEVNGKSLEDATHTEVISHIHQCIRSRTICLRVKRRTGNKLAVDLAASSNVQDAFVIAVEQQARERLERLSALKKIKPVDMTKLSSQLEPHKSVVSVGSSSGGQPSPGGRSPGQPLSREQQQQQQPQQQQQQKDDVNGVLEASPIYVTSVPNLTSEAPRARSRSRSSTPNRTSPSPRRHHSARSSRETPPTPLTPSPRREAPTLKSTESSPSVDRSSRRSSKRKGSTRLTNGHHGGSGSVGGGGGGGGGGEGSVGGVASVEAEVEANKSGDELELTHDLNDTLDDTEELDQDEAPDTQCDRTDSEDKLDLEGACLSESGDSLPGTPEKNYGIVRSDSKKSSRSNSRRDRASPREVLIDHDHQDHKSSSSTKTPVHAVSSCDSRDSTSSRKSGGSSGSGEVGGGTPRHKGTGGSTPRHSRRNRDPSRDNNSTPVSGTEISSYDNMISMVEFDPGHREMAVDVPESFVARTKTPPRYPPPKPQGQPITPIHNNNNNNSSKSSRKGGSSGSATPQNGTLPKAASPPRIPDQPQTRSPQLPAQQEGLMQMPSTQEEMIRMKKYEEELKLRREREEQEAMLRSSLRSSQKLQQLASHPLPTGVVNEGFSGEEQQAGVELKAVADTPSKVIGINELIQSLQRIQTVLKSNGHRISEDVTLVAQLLTNPEFQKVLAVHNKVQETWCLNRPPTPVTDNAQELLAESLQELQEYSVPEAAELIDILNKYSMEGLLYAHDRIAEREPLPVGNVPEEETVDRTSHYPEDSVKIVRIDKTNEPLGATIRNEGDSVIIGRIVKGGAAEKSGLLHEGDEILEVNGVEVRGKSVNDICDMLAGMTGTLTFIIIPCGTQAPPPRPPIAQTMHVKAHFDYDPEEDLYIPCRELGMSFQKGDILHVISQSDPNWWQAYRDGEEDQTLAGLIPSKTFQQHREAMRQTVVGDNNNKEKTKKGKLLCAKKHQKKKKKKMLYPNYNEDFDSEEILTYEEVALYYPRTNRKRPIVLIGPPNIGRHELRQKLMEDRERFAAAIPHTSRARRETEVDGQDYHFISRAQFESDILARKFVEHGEYEKAYYGTSIAAIRAVVNSEKICVLNLHPLSLKILKSSDLKPFVVFVAPPSLEKLRQKKIKMGEPVKDEELKETIEKAHEMEEQYGHYFDLIIINQDVDRAYHQLLQEINSLEREPQWVPAAWLAHDQ
ncbi:protein PALS1-like isoform X6 [Macrobrachium rosenbergii]|uniref:protein PALS1-like isoform X6 n=1 Tax=Macrobrachium rosenbergii TaxID=79674 RepID=UPI0034D5CB37